MAIDDGMISGSLAPSRWSRLIGALAVAVMVAVALVPAGAVAIRSLSETPGLDPLGGSAWARILGSSRTWRIMAVTIAQASASAVFSLVVGTPVAYVLARYRFPGRTVVRTVATVPFVLPSVVLGSAFAAIFSERGLLEARGSWWLVIAAHVSFNLAVVVRTVGAAIGSVDPAVEDAARVLGRSRPRTLWGVVLPQIRGSLAAAGLIIFLFCLTSFGVIVILGSGSVTTMEVEIWIRATRQFDLGGAAVLGMVQFVAVVATLFVGTMVARPVSSTARGYPGSVMAPVTVGERFAIGSVVAVVLVLCAVPLLALVWRSMVVPGGLGLDNWRHMGSVLHGTTLHVTPAGAIVNSVVFASAALVAALPLSLSSSRFVAGRRSSLLGGVILVPLGLSATMVGLGLLIVSPSFPFDLRRSFWMVPLAQLGVAVPLMARVLIPAFERIDTDVLEAASLLGASPSRRFWQVEFAHVLPALIAAGGLGFIMCMGEFGATVFVSRSDRMTVPVLVERLMSRPGGPGYGQAMALCVVLVIVCGLVLGVVDRLAAVRGRELIPI